MLGVIPSALFLLLHLTFATGEPSVSSQDYFDYFALNLTSLGLNLFRNALAVANTTANGQQLLSSLYSDNSFTIYAPTDSLRVLTNTSAWDESGLANPTANEDLNSLLAYHIAIATINSSSDVAPPRHHTVALTKLHSPTILLPGDQPQVLVLEQAQTTEGDSGPTILVRGDSWNATGTADQVAYENLHITPIDKILAIPSPLLQTLAKSGLAMAADMGATEYVGHVNQLDFNETLASCPGCTFFVPVNIAFEAARDQISGLGHLGIQVLLQNHILNGTAVYSPLFDHGVVYVTSAGQKLTYETNSNGSFFIAGEYTAKIIRSDIAVANGVVHLIDNVLFNTASDASSAVAAASRVSVLATISGALVTGTIGASNYSTQITTGRATATASSGSLQFSNDYGLWGLPLALLAFWKA